MEQNKSKLFYGKDICYSCFLGIVFILLTILTFGKWGTPIADCFREVYIPSRMLEGQILYKDILCLYTPAGYQLNALLFKLFGNGLNTLFFAALANAIIIFCGIYFFFKKFANIHAGFIAVLTVMCVNCFLAELSCGSWLFPYSFGMIYALSAALWSFIFAMLFAFKVPKDSFLYLSFLSAGLSLVFKPDFLLITLIPVFFLLKNFSLKKFVFSLMFYFLPLIFCIFVLCIQGFTFNDFTERMILWNAFNSSKVIQDFNAVNLPQKITGETIFIYFASLKHFAINIFTALISGFIGTFIFYKTKSKFGKILIFAISIFLCLTAGKFIAQNIISSDFLSFYGISFLPPTVIICTVCFFVFKFFKRISFDIYDKILLSVVVFAFLLSYRSFALLGGHGVGNYYSCAWVIALIYFIGGILPMNFGFLRKQIAVKTFILTVLIFCYGNAYASVHSGKSLNFRIDENQKYRTHQFFGETLRGAIDFAKNKIPPDSTVVVAEEGLIINYFAGRKSNDKYYSLIPHMIDMYGEENIVKDFEQNPPDYFMVTNHVYLDNNVFCKNYAHEICRFIDENYDNIGIIGTDKDENAFKIKVYKLSGNFEAKK